MSIDSFFSPKILIVSGKGGVGKTTVSAALAILAARSGRKVCIAEVDRKGTLPKLFGGGELDYDPAEIAPGVWGMNIVPDKALAEYLRVQYHMRGVARIFRTTNFVDYITTAAPGLKDILILGKIFFLEQNREGAGGEHRFDTIIVDAPAAGHMLTFLSAPMGLADALRVGSLQKQAGWIVSMLQDAKRSRVHLVTLAEEMPVQETIETSQALKDRLGIEQGDVFANSIYSELFTPAERKRMKNLEGDDGAALLEEGRNVGLQLDEEDVNELLGYASFLNDRRDIQTEHLKELNAAVQAPVMELPFLFSAGLALPDIEVLADVIGEGMATR